MSEDGFQREAWQTAWLESIEKRDPYVFAVGVLGFLSAGADNPNDLHQLEQWQDTFLREWNTSPRHSVRAGHGVGKGVVIAILALWFVSTFYDAKAVLTANSQDQLRDNNWPEIKKWRGQLPLALQEQVDIEEERLYISAAPEMSFCVRRTASKDRPEALQGIHAKHVLYLVDEASGIPDVVFEIAQGSLSTEGAMAALFSNPTRANGFFHSTHHNPEMRARWRTWHVNCEDVPRARGHIADVIAKFGKDSNQYRVRVQGEFPTKADDIVIPLELVSSALGRDVAMFNVWPVWGVDPARFGDDRTALVRRQGNHVLGPPVVWKNLDGAQVAGRIIALYNSTPTHEKPTEIVIDVIGIGASVYDCLRLPGSPAREITRGCNVAESASIADQYNRLRDELWFRGRQWFEKRDCSLPAKMPNHEDNRLIEELIGELTSPTYDVASNGKLVVESKADMKKFRGLRSPDIADAFLLTMAAGVYPRDNPHRRRGERPTTSWMAA